MPISLGELAARFGCELIGDPDVVIDDVATLGNAGSRSISFLSSSVYKRQLTSTRAAAVILRAEDAPASPTASLVTDNPYACYARIAQAIRPAPAYPPGVHASAIISSSRSEDRAVIGENVYIGPTSVVGPDCEIGADCRVLANVTLVRRVRTGKRCIFHSGCVIGADGFGNALTPEGWLKVPQFGGVRIGDDVEVGSSTTIDCGAIEDTVIGDGVRLDNQIQIAHNVVVGEHTAMATGCAIAGSARIGKRCMFAGMVGMAGHIEVCDDVVVNGKGMISKSITEPGVYASNFPIEPVRTWNRRVALVRRLDQLYERVSELEKRRK